MGGTCSTFNREVHTGLYWEHLKKRKPRRGICRRWKCSSEQDLEVTVWGVFDWFQIRENWQAVLTTVMNSQVSEHVSTVCRI